RRPPPGGPPPGPTGRWHTARTLSIVTRRLAYLGPQGTFTEAALQTLPHAADAEHVPYATVPSVLEAVRRGAADGAVVALENSVEGSVPTTLDELATGEPLQVVGEIHLPVSFALLVRPGTAFS